MTLRRLVVPLVLAVAALVSLPATERYMAVDEVRPGMTGVGRTVFEGNRIEEFTVRILGVLRSTIAPRRDLVLAKLEGGPLAKTGVIAGMSGSPVYVDGRLIGAVAYSLGAFPTEAIAGITPIAEMVDAARTHVPRGAAVPHLVPPRITADTWRDMFNAMAPTARPFATAASDVRALAGVGLDPSMATGLRPIATPLSLGALTGSFAAPLVEVFARAGFVATPAAAGVQSAAPVNSPLRPGDPVGVTLVSGDYVVGATGTVTEVDGDHVYAFGHPFFGLGPARLPMTRAFVHALLPSLAASTKIASTGDVIGSFTQDRATVLAGRLGVGPDTIPLRVTLTSAQGQRRDLRVTLAVDPFFTPLLGFVAVGSAISTYERDLGANTYAVRGRMTVRGHGPVEIDDVFTGDSAAAGVASTVMVPLAALLTNDREPVQIDDIAVDVRAHEAPRTVSIERAWIDTVEVRPGRPATLKVLLRPRYGADDLRTVVIDVPAHASGPLTVVVADAPRATQFEERDGRSAPPASVRQIIGQINRLRRSNRLYVRVYSGAAGAVIGGEPLPALPNSIRTVVEGDRGGSQTSLSGAPIASWEFPVDGVVSGGRTLTINPIPFVRRP